MGTFNRDDLVAAGVEDKFFGFAAVIPSCVVALGVTGTVAGFEATRAAWARGPRAFLSFCVSFFFAITSPQYPVTDDLVASLRVWSSWLRLVVFVSTISVPRRLRHAAAASTRSFVPKVGNPLISS